jgi:hypothetical protein
MLDRRSLQTPDLLSNRVIQLLDHIPSLFPCYGLSLSVSKFEAEERGIRTIKDFFKSVDKSPPTTSEADKSDITASDLDGINKQESIPASPVSTPQPSVDDEFSIVCEQCQQRIHLTELMEHQDYHLAVQLDAEERAQYARTNQTPPQPTTTRSNTNTPRSKHTNNKRTRRPPTPCTPTKNRKLSEFFPRKPNTSTE